MAGRDRMKNSNTDEPKVRNMVEVFVTPNDAHALRPVRFMPDDQLKYYTGVTFPNGAKNGCDIYRRRCDIAGGIPKSEDQATGICDILNKEGDIVADFWLNDKGLRFLYQKLNLRVDADA